MGKYQDFLFGSETLQVKEMLELHITEILSQDYDLAWDLHLGRLPENWILKINKFLTLSHGKHPPLGPISVRQWLSECHDMCLGLREGQERTQIA